MTQMSNKSQAQTVSEMRRERERAVMTERIMDAAREMFVRDGYQAVTLRGIAKSIEYSQAAIYQYFADKQALVKAIIRKDAQDLRENLAECMKIEEPIARMIEMARRYAAWGITHPNHYRLMLVPPPTWVEQDCKLDDQDPIPLEQEALSVLTEAVKQAIDCGMLKEKYTDSALVAAMLWAAIHGAILHEIIRVPKEFSLLGGEGHTFERLFNAFLELFADGFLRNEVNPPRALLD